MRYSLSWLARYVDLRGVDLDWLADRFVLSVAEIDAVERLGEGLAPVQVARVGTVEAHPGADRLKLCTIEAEGGTHKVVCGAPNVREGMLTAFAPPGTRLAKLEVKAAEIRGVQSAGMLCSEKELGLTDDHSGIMDLDGDFEPGTAFSKVADVSDVVWEVDNKSITHRPDLWGHLGVAREVASLLDRPLTPPPAEVQLSDDPAPAIEVLAPEQCPRYLAVGLTGIRIAAAPLWMRVLVYRCGMRPISNVVDATNFAMLELGNPLHAFDAREVLGRKIIVRMAQPAERVVTLDEKERSLSEADLLICDSERPVAIAGVMGLENSEVKEDTRDVILESANFRAETVRRTALRLGLRTEASSRFEKSLDPNLPPVAARRFARLLCEVCPGAKVSSAVGDFAAGPFEPKLVRTSVSYVNRRLGTELDKDRVHSHLNGLELEVTDLDGDEMEVRVPTFRAMRDIGIPEDLVEEVGRLHGYDHITPAQPVAHIPAPYCHEDRTLHRRLKLCLSLQAGFTEVQRYSFDFEPFLERIGRGPWPRIAVKNPISAELTHLRPRVLPGLIQALE